MRAFWSRWSVFQHSEEQEILVISDYLALYSPSPSWNHRGNRLTRPKKQSNHEPGSPAPYGCVSKDTVSGMAGACAGGIEEAQLNPPPPPPKNRRLDIRPIGSLEGKLQRCPCHPMNPHIISCSNKIQPGKCEVQGWYKGWAQEIFLKSREVYLRDYP